MLLGRLVADQDGGGGVGDGDDGGVGDGDDGGVGDSVGDVGDCVVGCWW